MTNTFTAPVSPQVVREIKIQLLDNGSIALAGDISDPIRTIEALHLAALHYCKHCIAEASKERSRILTPHKPS